jgi:hypothetical protein
LVLQYLLATLLLGLVPQHLWKIPTGDPNVDTGSCTSVLVPPVDPTPGVVRALAPSFAPASPNNGCCYLKDSRHPPADDTTSSCYASFASDTCRGDHSSSLFAKPEIAAPATPSCRTPKTTWLTCGSPLPPDDDPS